MNKKLQIVIKIEYDEELIFGQFDTMIEEELKEVANSVGVHHQTYGSDQKQNGDNEVVINSSFEVFDYFTDEEE
jgi:hypothetical protein